jgi:hypothetical protein
MIETHEEMPTVVQPASRKIKWQPVGLVLLGILVLLNLAFLNYRVLFGLSDSSDTQVASETRNLKDWFGLVSQDATGGGSQKVVTPTVVETEEAILPEETAGSGSACPAVCLEEIAKISARVNDQICPQACLDEMSVGSASVADEVVTPAAPVASMLVKEVYIPLGKGSTTSKTYTNLMGTEAVLDSNNFTQIKSMIFEASMRIPTANGKVYAKLYNVTDKHDVWFSEVSAEGDEGYRAESAEISFDSGRKLYRVMMKSTMGYEAILDWARIKIILE